MIEYRHGNIFDEDVEALVNSVNCVGVMGRGIALQFKKNYPANFKAYEAACKREEVQPGRMFVFETGSIGNPRYIINFPTKNHWRERSRLEYIETGLDALRQEIEEREIRSIAIPPLGTDLGKLDWEDVRPRIEAALTEFPNLSATIFSPGSAATVKPASSPVPPKMTVARAVLVSLARRYLKGFLDPFVTLLELHKLMYFMQESGEPLKLQFAKEAYGPYAKNLRHLLLSIDSHMITGYGQGGEQPYKQIELVDSAVDEAEHFLSTHPATLERLERVAKLIEGFETAYGIELLATVHWVANENSSEDLDDVIANTHGWSDRKRQFSRQHIELALDVLRENGFIAPADGQAIPFAFHQAAREPDAQASMRFEGM